MDIIEKLFQDDTQYDSNHVLLHFELRDRNHYNKDFWGVNETIIKKKKTSVDFVCAVVNISLPDLVTTFLHKHGKLGMSNKQTNTQSNQWFYLELKTRLTTEKK